MVVGDTVSQRFQWTLDSIGSPLTNSVLRVTLRREDRRTVLALLTSYPGGGLVPAANQTTSAGVFNMRLEAYQTESWPFTEELFGDVELTTKSTAIGLAEDVSTTAGSAVITVDAADAALLRPTQLIEVNSILLTITAVGTTTITTDYVWPATATYTPGGAWQADCVTKTFNAPTVQFR